MANSHKRALEKVLQQQAAMAEFGTYAFRERDLQKVLMEGARLCAKGTEVPFGKVLKYLKDHNDLIVQAGIGWREDIVGKSISEAGDHTPGGAWRRWPGHRPAAGQQPARPGSGAAAGEAGRR